MPSALAALALTVSGCGSGHHAPKPSATTQTQTSTPSQAIDQSATHTRKVGPQSIVEAGLQLAADPAGTLDILRKLGVDRVKIFVPWSFVSPNSQSSRRPSFNATDPAAYPAGAWDRYDAIIRDAKARGIGVDVTLSTPPPWAAGSDSPNPVADPQWKPSPSAFGAFVRAVGKRYSGTYTPPGSASPLPRVDFWSVWNEPNYGQTLAPTTIDNSKIEVSPRLYRGLVDAAWSALDATGHGQDTVLIGELGPHGITGGAYPGTFGPMVPLRFVRALYCVDQGYHQLRGTAAAQRGCPTTASASVGFRAAHPGLFKASGFADHPYPAADIPPNQAIANEPDFADLPALPNLERALDRSLAAYGSDRALPIYSTEYGYQTNPPRATGNSTTPERAAVYLNWAEYISWRDPRVASYDQFLLQDPANGGSPGGFPSGLLFFGGTPKPTYAAFRMPLFLPVTSVALDQAIEVWGCVRPAHFAKLDTGATQHVEIQFEPAGGSAFETIATVTLTDPHGYFDIHRSFSRSGTVRLAWSYPRGPTIFSRAVGIHVR